MDPPYGVAVFVGWVEQRDTHHAGLASRDAVASLPVPGRERPMIRGRRISVLHGIVVHIVHMRDEVGLVANHVFPISALPYAALTLPAG